MIIFFSNVWIRCRFSHVFFCLWTLLLTRLWLPEEMDGKLSDTEMFDLFPTHSIYQSASLGLCELHNKWLRDKEHVDVRCDSLPTKLVMTLTNGRHPGWATAGLHLMRLWNWSQVLVELLCFPPAAAAKTPFFQIYVGEGQEVALCSFIAYCPSWNVPVTGTGNNSVLC